MDRPLDRAAKDLLHWAPVITLDAGDPVLLLLRAGLRADDVDTSGRKVAIRGLKAVRLPCAPQ